MDLYSCTLLQELLLADLVIGDQGDILNPQEFLLVPFHRFMVSITTEWFAKSRNGFKPKQS